MELRLTGVDLHQAITAHLLRMGIDLSNKTTSVVFSVGRKGGRETTAMVEVTMAEDAEIVLPTQADVQEAFEVETTTEEVAVEDIDFGGEVSSDEDTQLQLVVEEVVEDEATTTVADIFANED